MTVDDWLACACDDAGSRGLEDLKPLLAALAEAMRALRAAGWDDGSRAHADQGSVEAPAPPADGASG